MRGLILLVIVLIAAAIVIPQTFYTIDVTQQGIVTRFGAVKVVRTEPGLYTKTPFVEQIRRFDRRLLRYDAPAAPLLTKDKRTLVIDAYARYRITDPVLFFQTLNSELNADARVGDIIASELRREVALDDQITVIRDARADIMRRVTEASNRTSISRAVVLEREGGLRDPQVTITLSELTDGVVTAAPRAPTPDELAALEQAPEPASLSRYKIEYFVPVSERLGIEIVDVRIKGADFPPDIEDSVFARMQAERERIADGLRAEGNQENAEIRADVDRQITVILQEAEGSAARLRGEGEAEAIRILAEELEKDPEFYVFQRSLEAYRKILASNTTVVLSSGSELFNYLENPTAPLRATTTPANAP